MRKIIFLFLMTLCFTQMTQAQTDLSYHSLTYDNQERHYYLYTPASRPEKLLIALHPIGANGRGMAIMTGLNDWAERDNFAVLYPDMLHYYWDDGRVAAGVRPDSGQVDDAGFLRRIALQVRNELGIAPENVYLTGLESGASMALTIACQSPQDYAGIIAIGALLWDYQVEQCPETSGASNLLLIHGAKDPLYLPNGNEMEFLSTGAKFQIYGVNDTFDFYRERYACEESSFHAFNVSQVLVYTDCNGGSLALYTVAEGSGQWLRKSHHVLNQGGVDFGEIITAFMGRSEDWHLSTVNSNPSSELPRSYALYVPSTYTPNQATPLVMLLHGRLSNAAAQAYFSDFNRIAEREGIIAVYPNGINPDDAWNYTKDLPVFISSKAHDDDAFLTTLIDDLALDLNIDQSRVYVTGLSNGGFMTQRLACTRQDRFAAFASVAATAPIGLRGLCEGQGASPMLYIHGTSDPIVLWEGQRDTILSGTTIWIYESMESTLGFWMNQNGCELSVDIGDALPQTEPDLETHIVTVGNCPEDSPVLLYMVIGGGHVWHGVQPSNSIAGRSSQDFNSSEVIWEFFQQFQLGN